jgi:hypothetical protein
MNRIFVPRPTSIRPPIRRFSHAAFRLRDDAETTLRDVAYVLSVSRRLAAEIRKPVA